MTDFPFVAINNNFKIEIRTEFDFTQSNPMQFQYLFAYFIKITNMGSEGAKLLSRKWHIKDGKGEQRIVEGPGVVGFSPYFRPGESFEYQSFCPLQTLEGEMWGFFNMVDDEGKDFRIDTPMFRFKVPSEYIDVY